MNIPGPISFNLHQPMYSGRDEVVQHRYHVVMGNKGKRWLYTDEQGAGDQVYAEGGPNSDGFGGAVLSFPLVDGTTLDLKGPWHASPDGLFRETGVDLRNRFFTTGIIALKRESGKWPGPDTYTEILHFDDNKPVLGEYARIRILAEKMANELGTTVYYAFVSKGGGCGGPAKPTPSVSLK